MTNEENNRIPDSAVSLYRQPDDALDDFPVLKAFQQYIDAEQSKARKRLLYMGIFFGVMMFIVIAVFVALLMRTTSQNQALNDRLLELALRDRDTRGSSAVVVQPPQDTSGLMALNAKLDEVQKKLAESQAKAERAVAEAAAAREKAETESKAPSKQELEIEHLKALLKAEKEKAAEEKERKHQEELEAYRRKYYPELYERPRTRRATKKVERDIDEELDELSIDPDDDEEEEIKRPTRRMRRHAAPSRGKSLEEMKAVNYFDNEEEAKAPSPEPVKNNYSIPVDIKGSSSNFEIPLD